jgi:hypothetical protein
MGYIRANGAIGISLRENGRHIAHSVSALLVSAPVPEREEDRGCDIGWGPEACLEGGARDGWTVTHMVL